MLDTVYAKLIRYSLDSMEKLDARDTRTKKLGYEFARKTWEKAFVQVYGYNPYIHLSDEEL